MADISACEYEKCAKKLECWRYMCERSQWQSYALFNTICNEENNYEWFYDIGNKSIREVT